MGQERSVLDSQKGKNYCARAEVEGERQKVDERSDEGCGRKKLGRENK